MSLPQIRLSGVYLSMSSTSDPRLSSNDRGSSFQGSGSSGKTIPAGSQGIISVDVEEFYHAQNLEPVAGPRTWHSLPSRVEAATMRILELFDRFDTKGTFFVLGCTARRAPQMVREIAARGHEVASHGYGHRLAYLQSERQFYRDVYRSKRLLEQLVGQEVTSYRAPNFSIKDQNQWAYDTLLRAGYRYDSSLYPIWHPRYANLGKPHLPYVLNRENGALGIVPLAVWPLSVFGKDLKLPVAGGAYWRTLPKLYSFFGLRAISRSEKPYCCYFHPWELDAGQPYFTELPLLTRWRHYGGTAQFERRLEYFLERFKFTSLRELAPQLFGNTRLGPGT